MRQLKVKFRGGPLDGTTKTADVPDRWGYLKIEERQGDRYHRYCGPIPTVGASVTLDYRGCEVLNHEA